MKLTPSPLVSLQCDGIKYTHNITTAVIHHQNFLIIPNCDSVPILFPTPRPWQPPAAF